MLLEDPLNELEGLRFKTLAEQVTEAFPSIDILLLYGQPLTSWTTGQEPPDQSQWRLRQPQLTEVSILCEKYFLWISSGRAINRFKDTLWPGVAV